MGKPKRDRDREPEITTQADREKMLKNWVPKTQLGRKVLALEVTSLEELLKSNTPILEPEIVDYLKPMEEKILEIRKTTRVIRAGRKFSFRVAVLVGNRDGIVGLGIAKDREKWPAARKAAARAKLCLALVGRGCGSWECKCGTQHSVPFRVTGKNAALHITFYPAPKGVGLVAGNHIKPLLELAGIKDVWSNTQGGSSTPLNFARAAMDALEKTHSIKAGMREGKETQSSSEEKT